MSRAAASAQVIHVRFENYFRVHARLATWIGAVLAVGVIAAGAHAAGSPTSPTVSTSAPRVAPKTTRPAGTVRAALVVAPPPSSVAVAVASTTSTVPGAAAPEPAATDIVTAQPISFVASDSAVATAAPLRTVALYGDSLTVMAWEHYESITADEVQTDGHAFGGTNLADWHDAILSNPHDRLVLALGTNDAGRDGAAPWADLFNKLPASTCIVWPKPYEGSSPIKLFNTQMAAIVAAHPNVHVIDWNAQVQAHPEWVQYDHTHYLPEGSDHYAEMLREAALTCP